MWLLFAPGSAFFAGGTSILAKCGIKDTDSNVATVVFSYFVFGEKLKKKAAVGLVLLIAGTIAMTRL